MTLTQVEQIQLRCMLRSPIRQKCLHLPNLPIILSKHMFIRQYDVTGSVYVPAMCALLK